jgi:predicted nucleotidyltransferase
MEDFDASPDLRRLAKAIADWLRPAPEITFYLYGSRVRGDHRSDSDVDILRVLPQTPTRVVTCWWTEQNLQDFKTLRDVLPGRLEFLENNPALERDIKKGRIVLRDRNVICVWLPPKTR